MIEVAPVTRETLPASVALVARVFDFTDKEVVPAWQVWTSVMSGGLAFVATESAGEVIGFAHAFDVASDGEGRAMFLTEVAVDPAHQSKGVGTRLLEAVGRAGRRAGVSQISFTTNAADARNLYFYLSRLNVAMVGLHEGLYVGLLHHHAHGSTDCDEAELRWILDGEPLVGPRQGMHDRDSGDVEVVSVGTGVNATARMRALLDRGLIGVQATRTDSGTDIEFRRVPSSTPALACRGSAEVARAARCR